ncbi:MAG: PAS domain S-box protein [Desulfobacterales bacterium]|nr:MAG: PAS domain S-box protein [Desulfobacterales bacterium]
MDTPIRLLIIDDSIDDALLLVRQLKKNGFNPTYKQVDTAEAMSDALDAQTWDAILCDYSMPNFSMHKALDLYKKKQLDLPFIIVSGTITDETAVAAMKAGAHDYIIKDNLARLSPAMDRELRETKVRHERRLAKYELIKSEEKYRTLFEESRDAIYISAKQGKFIGFNQSTTELFGYSKEEMLGMNTKDIFVNADEYRKLQEEINQKGSVRDFEAKLYKRDGSEMNCLITSTVRRSKDENIMGYQGIIRDISELVLSQQKLEKTLEKLRKALGGTIQAMALTVETRDPYTAGHQRRVSNLACAIGREMGLPANKIQGIHFAGIIHDIGKISVPGEILSKPGRISENELGIIKEHPRAGHNILKTVDFPWPIAQIVLQHHEKIDGSGYPDGISGETILIESRILSVADVIEAMSSHRPYRPTLGVDAALKEIQQNRDVLYDAEVVDTCLKLFKERGYRL